MHSRKALLLAAALLCYLLAATPMPVAQAQKSYAKINGEGSSWAAGAIEDIRVNVNQFGITVNYNPSGSTNGRKNFLRGIVDFAASDIPFQRRPEDGSDPDNPAPGSYAYIPVTAGGTSFIYNLKINGQRVTNLRLSGENVAKLFTGGITSWNDPALQADNPGLVLPDRKVVPVVRSDGSGSTAQFTQWLISQHGGIWNDYCRRSGRAPACGLTSFYPTIGGGMIGKSGDLGVTGHVTQGFAEGAIGYVNYFYAIGAQFPVAKVLNAAGFYTEPTPENVAVSLLRAQINRDEKSDDYLTQQLADVYTDPDQRNYPLSSYSYFILPTMVPEPGKGNFSADKGRTLGFVTYYAMCQAQQNSASLGYSPLPINLVQASFEQIRRIPGVEVQNIDITTCKNPTFSADGSNVLAQNAPKPQECDKKGPKQCATGTGGIKAVATPVSPAAAAPTGGAGPAPSAAPGPGTAPGAAQDTSALAAGGTPGTATGGGGGTGPDAAAGPVACDPDTGVCGTGTSGRLTAAGQSSAAAGTSEQAVASSTVLAGSSGRVGYAALIGLVLLLTLALVFAPAFAWQYLTNRQRQ